MKLERLSENQIKCTLYKSDLADKELLLTELAYGTDKAKELFRELMQQAEDELGFEVDNIPIMIEAIPVSQECLILIITKVEDPEELDTRFSRFTKPISRDTDFGDDEEDDDDEDDIDVDDAEDMDESSMETLTNSIKNSHIGQILESLGDLAGGIAEAAKGSAKSGNSQKANKSTENKKMDLSRVYMFNKLDDVIVSAKLVKNIYKSDNTLYKNPKDRRFYLYMTKDKDSDTDFMRCCNMVNEYGNRIKTTYSTKGHMDEHFKVIIEANALQKLSTL